MEQNRRTVWAWRLGFLGAAVLLVAALFWERAERRFAAVLPVVVAGATVAYALLTRKLVNATLEMRDSQRRLTLATAEALEAQTRPNVIVYMELHNFLVDLTVKNIGAGEARDVTFRVIGSLEDFPQQEATKARFLKEGFSFLAPGQSHAVMLANAAAGRPKEGEEWASADIAATYHSREGRRYEGVFPLRLKDFENTAILEPRTPVGRIAQALEKSIEALKEIAKAIINRAASPR